jgi:hypothetical protein
VAAVVILTGSDYSEDGQGVCGSSGDINRKRVETLMSCSDTKHVGMVQMEIFS